MSTRIKLIILVLLTSVAGLSSLVINTLLMRPVRIIEQEHRVLEELQHNLNQYAGEANMLVSELFRAKLPAVKKAGEKLEGSFNGLKELDYLPLINNTIKESIDTILLYRGSLSTTQKNFEERIKGVIAVADRFIGKDEDFTLFQLAWMVVNVDNKLESDEIRKHVFMLTASINALNRNIQTTLKNTKAQNETIDNEIRKHTKSAKGRTFLIILLVMIIPFVIALLIANMIAGRIRKIDTGIARMKDGDLADRIEINSRDEMGRLSNNVNSFTDELGHSLLEIRKASRSNDDIKNALLDSISRVASTTEQVDMSVKSISDGMDKLRETVTVTDNAGETVEKQLDQLESVLNDQVAMVEESTAAITEMIAAVGNVSEIITKKRSVLAGLVDYSREGGSRLANTNSIISIIHDSIEEIRGITKIISGIAGQTNLLAMNAAIEAAHAGDAGRGFAVVATEIRNLAEATSKNSNQISGIMKQVIENIVAAAESGKDTGEAFTRIDGEVSETASAFDEIVQGMAELKLSGEQILKAMVNLNDFSGKVKDGDISIREAADENRKAIGNVESISRQTNEQITGILQAINTLISEMDTVESMTGKADDISRTLQSEVSKYRLNEN